MIILADKQIITAVACMNTIFSLELGSIGPALALDLVETGEIFSLCNNVIKLSISARRCLLRRF